MRSVGTVAACLVVLCAALPPRPVAGTGQQSQPTFRSRVTLVPIDVRVLDADGRPVAGLKRGDFAVTEDGVGQQIVHFSFSSLEPTPPPDGPPELRKPLGPLLSPPTRRTFLFVLGRGRQVGPGKDVRAAVDFIRNRLLPQDQVAILAYNRTTPFTTDHASAAVTLQSYWDRHELIEARLDHHFSGLAASYADPEIPPHIQRLVDDIFRQPGVLHARHVTPGDVVDRARYEDEMVRDAGPATADAETVVTGLMRNSPTLRDIENLYAGITYMRYLEGEKHLVFLTPQGLDIQSLDRMTTLASLASDARVALDIVHTYGMIGAPPPDRYQSFAIPTADQMFSQRFRIGNSRHMSDLTGGETSVFKYGSATFARLDRTTRAQYLLGYAPSNAGWDGNYRRIRVTVNRPNVRVLYRHGYYAREQQTPLDRRTFMTYSRIMAAAKYPQPIRDIALTLEDVTLTGGSGSFVVTARGHIEAGAIQFGRDGAVYTATLEAFFTCGDRAQESVGEVWQTLDFRLTEDNYNRFLKEGVSFAVRVAAKVAPAHLKVVVYDYGADAIGAMAAKVKR